MVYTIPEIPPSNNRYIGRDVRWRYQAEKRRWAGLIALYCHPRPQKPVGRAVVTIRYYFPDWRRRDPDNYSGKMLLDGLVRCGVLEDDSFSCVSLRLEARKDKENPRTEIEIEETRK